MRKGRVKKCFLWLLLLTITQVTAMIFLLVFGPTIASGYFQFNLSYFGMGLSSVSLLSTILVFVLLVPRTYTKKLFSLVHTIAMYSFATYALGFYLAFDITTSPDSVISYVSLGIAGMILAINIALIFLLQTWLVTEILEFSLPNVWPTHTLFAMWMSFVLFFPDNFLFIAISAVAVLATAPVTLLIEVVRVRKMKKRLGKIYS